MHHSDRQTLELSDIASVLHERTGIPAETLLGCSDETDFAAALSAAVVGQPNAVETAARELRLIKAGLSAPGKPASVMLFAGLTGVGKTELAKRIAEVYSTSRRLQVYSMGNFTEPHSVSGIIGVPPGYVGHAGTAGSCRL
jgi:ATP-dependent Clp protease ATP-binding subunit ClpA